MHDDFVEGTLAPAMYMACMGIRKVGLTAGAFHIFIWPWQLMSLPTLLQYKNNFTSILRHEHPLIE